MNKKILTPKFRVAFPNVFKPKLNQQNEPKYGLVMLFDKDTDMSKLKELADEAAREKWPKGVPTDLRSPFRDGNEKADKYEGFRDTIAVTTNSSYKPGVVNQKVEEIINQEGFYAGCYARASVTAYAYEKLGNKGVSFSLENLQKLEDGEHMSGKTGPKDDFGPVTVGEEKEVSKGLFDQ